VVKASPKPQTVTQILRCLTLGRYTACVIDGRLETEGPQPLAGPLPASIKARRDELTKFLEDRCGGVWPPAKDSEFYEIRKGRSMAAPPDRTVGVWDTEWAAQKAANALQYLGRNFPECLENLRVLDEPEEAANEAAMRGDRDAYLEALRDYCRAGRDEALRIRRGAA
jgi:hypothetical protein